MAIELPQLSEAELAADRIEQMGRDLILQAQHLRAAYRVRLADNRPSGFTHTRVNKTKLNQEIRQKALLEKLAKRKSN